MEFQPIPYDVILDWRVIAVVAVIFYLWWHERPIERWLWHRIGRKGWFNRPK